MLKADQSTLVELHQKNDVKPLPLFKGLVNCENIAMLVKYSLLSHYVRRDIAPLSLLLIAPSEHNKTRILLRFKHFPNTKVIESISAKPLNEFVKSQDEKQKYFHIIILDFVRTIQLKYVVAEAVLGTFLNLIDEGLQSSMFYGQEYVLKHRVQMGVISGITPDLFKKHFVKWNQSGQITRFLFCSYRYSDLTHNQIQDYISKDLPNKIDDAIVKIKKHGFKDIKIDNSDIASAVQLLSEDVTKRLRGFNVTRRAGKNEYRVYLNMEGFRLHKMLRLLIKSIAYDNERDSVNYEDLRILKGLSEYLNLPNNPKEV